MIDVADDLIQEKKRADRAIIEECLSILRSTSESTSYILCPIKTIEKEKQKKSDTPCY